jgi:hypothetical protein
MESGADHPSMVFAGKAATDAGVKANACADRTKAGPKVEARAAAGANVITNTARGLMTAALGPASRTTAHRVRRAAMKMTTGNPVAKTATTIGLGVAVRAASTSVAHAAVDSMLDTVADIAVDAGVDIGKDATLKAAQAAARAVRDIATTATDRALNMVALAKVTPVTSAAADMATLAATTAAKNTVARFTADVTIAARNAVTLAATRAAGSAVSVIGTDALRNTMRDALKAAVKAAVTEAVKELLKSTERRHPEPVPLTP